MLFWLKSGLYMLDKIPYCFTKSEVISQFSSKDQFDNWIKTKIKNKSLLLLANRQIIPKFSQ